MFCSRRGDVDGQPVGGQAGRGAGEDTEGLVECRVAVELVDDLACGEDEPHLGHRVESGPPRARHHRGLAEHGRGQRQADSLGRLSCKSNQR